MKTFAKLISAAVILILLNGCASRMSSLKTTILNESLTQKQQSILVYTADIYLEKEDEKTKKWAKKTLENKRVKVDAKIVKKLNDIGVKAIHKKGKFDKRTLIDLSENYSDYDSVLVNIFKFGFANTRMYGVYNIFDTANKKTILKIDASFLISNDPVFNSISDPSEFHANSILKELQKQKIVCCNE